MRRASWASTSRSSISRVSLERLLDRVAGDLVEDHAPDGHLRLQHLEQVPGDRLALAVLVRREQELVGALELLLELRDRLLLVRIDDVERLESCSTSTPRRAQDSPLYFSGISAALSGRSRMWPTEDSTTKSGPR